MGASFAAELHDHVNAKQLQCFTVKTEYWQGLAGLGLTLRRFLLIVGFDTNLQQAKACYTFMI